MSNENAALRLIFPQWQGGNNSPYYLGSQILEWLAPKITGIVEVVNVTEPKPENAALQVENGISWTECD